MLSKEYPEQNRGYGHDTRQRRIHDDQMRVLGDRRERHRQARPNPSRSHPHRLDHRLHRLRGLVVGIFGPRGEAENLRNRTENIDRRLQKHRDLIGNVAMVRRRASQRVIVTGARGIDQLLQDRGVDHGESEK